MSCLIIIVLTAGVIAGRFVQQEAIAAADTCSSIMLYLLVFSVGIDMGRNKKVFSDIKKLGARVLLIPGSVLAGSFLGGLIATMILPESVKDSLAIASGLGWYSFSGIILTNAGRPAIGAIAFLSNVFREILAFILIPALAKKMGYYCAIAPAGATAMDTTLAIISRNTDGKTAVLAFLTGVLLTSIVPIIMPLFL